MCCTEINTDIYIDTKTDRIIAIYVWILEDFIRVMDNTRAFLIFA